MNLKGILDLARTGRPDMAAQYLGINGYSTRGLSKICRYPHAPSGIILSGSTLEKDYWRGRMIMLYGWDAHTAWLDWD